MNGKNILIIGLLIGSAAVFKIKNKEKTDQPSSVADSKVLRAPGSVVTPPAQVTGAAAPVTTNFSAQGEDPFVEVEIALTQLNQCYTEPCQSEDEDPTANYYDVGQKIKHELVKLRAYVQIKNIVDPRVSEIARENISNSDGHVQEVALDLMATQSPSHENLEAILENVVKGYDAELIDQALTELQRYPSPADQGKIHAVLGEELLHGAPFVANAIAQKIEMFLNPESLEYFESLMSRIDQETTIYMTLHSTFKEYRQKASDG